MDPLGDMLPVLLIIVAVLIIVATASVAVWDNRKNRPRAMQRIEDLSSKLKGLPEFARGEFSAALDGSQALLDQKRYRECIRRTDGAIKELEQLIELIKQGRDELRSIDAKVEQARAGGLTIDREAIGLESVRRFWGQRE